MWPRLRITGQWLAAVAWVQVHVAAKRPVVVSVFDQERFVATLIKMTGPSVSLGVPIRIAGQPMLHAACQQFPVDHITARQQEHLIDGIYGSFRPPCEYEKHPNEKTQKGTGNNIQLTNNALYDLFYRHFRNQIVDLTHQTDRFFQADDHPLCGKP